MNVLLIGSGAREHAMAKALSRSSQNPKIFYSAASPNSGIEALAEGFQILDLRQKEQLVKQALSWKIDLAIVGPEAPLEQGLIDFFWQQAIPAIGPTRAQARIESSKQFARELMSKESIPGSPKHESFNSMNQVLSFMQALGETNYVIKPDGLTAGKGVKLAGEHFVSYQEGLLYCETLLSEGKPFLIEEKLLGQEFSLFCFSDGRSLIPMPIVQDFKRAYNGNRGPNTGGMGSYTEANHRLSFLTSEDIQKAFAINRAMLDAIQKETAKAYRGILYGSFMKTRDGIALIEFNVRFGDPEALNLLALLETDFLDICTAILDSRLSETNIRFANQASVCKYLVPHGYPESPIKPGLIDFSQLRYPERLYIGSLDYNNGQYYTAQSRTAALVALADNLEDAKAQVESEIQCISGPVFYREDIPYVLS